MVDGVVQGQALRRHAAQCQRWNDRRLAPLTAQIWAYTPGGSDGKQLLVVSPVGKAGDATTFDTDASDNPIVLVNDDPTGSGTWRNYSPLRMNDPNNNAFFTIYAADRFLYAGVNNDVTGAQVWRTAGCPTRRS